MNPQALGHIEIGNHTTATLAGLTFNIDTIISTIVAGAIVIALGFWMRAKITSGVPSGIQLTWETAVSQIEAQVEESMGLRVAPFVVPLAVSLFFFILIANWLELIPTMEHLRSPTADANTTYALAILVIVWMHAISIKRNGVKNYFGHFFKPNPVLFPINLIEEIVKPFTLALRLFGNIFSGGIMLALIGLFPAFMLWLPNAAWKLFDAFIGLIQAFIFALLTILYFSFQLKTEEGH